MTAQPLRFRGSDSLLVVAAHPDDETLAAGGLLQQAHDVRAPVTVLIATDGENNPWPQRVLERRWRIGPEDQRRFGKRRRAEVGRALARLGLDESRLVFLSLPDQGLTRVVMDDADPAVGRLRSEIALRQPTIVVGPSTRDRHPDHSALALLLEIALQARIGDLGAPPLRLLRYQVHGRRPPQRHADACEVRLTKPQRERKRQAILAYRSQLVFRGRFFLSFAGERELLEGTQTAARRDSSHPIREAWADTRHVHLQIRSRSPIWSLQPKTLLLLGIDAAARPIAVTSPAADGEVVLDRSRLRGARRLFAKLEHRWSFFDADGWREISLADPPCAQPNDRAANADASGELAASAPRL